jgi:hypothetical protein
MLTWARRLFVVAPAVRDLRERVSILEADLEYVAFELKKLRGRLTGGIRTSQDAPGSTNGGPPASQLAWLKTLDPVSRKIWEQRLLVNPNPVTK